MFLDNIPEVDNWTAKQLLKFSTYRVVYNMMAYNQDYETQPIYKIDTLYSSDSDHEATNTYRSYL